MGCFRIFPVFLILITSAVAGANFDRAVSSDAMFYRDFTTKIRSSANFKVAVPGNVQFGFRYQLKFGVPLFSEPILGDLPLGWDTNRFLRSFWDKVFLLDESTLQIGNEQIPLTCVFIDGQDNRFSGKDSPLIPDFLIKVYLVANDFTCTGPLNPGWPESGGKRETWDTYAYFEIRDPTIMLPTEIKLRYRWTEYIAYLADEGSHQ